MQRLTKELFDHIKAAVKQAAAEMDISGVLTVTDRVTKMSMYDYIGRDNGLRIGVEGKDDANFTAIAFAKNAAVIEHGCDTPGEKVLKGEVPYKGGHPSADGEAAYGFSGGPAEKDLELMLVAEKAHASYRHVAAPSPIRRKLPEERRAITNKFDISGHEGYITVGLYEDGTPGEIFLVMAKEGSTISGFADAFAQAISYALQYGVPLSVLVDKFSHMRFEPSGMTKNPQVRFAKSIIDYVFRWMDMKFLRQKTIEQSNMPSCEKCGTVKVLKDGDYVCPKCSAFKYCICVEPHVVGEKGNEALRCIKCNKPAAPGFNGEVHDVDDNPPCPMCGAIMIASGIMWKCPNCGGMQGR